MGQIRLLDVCLLCALLLAGGRSSFGETWNKVGEVDARSQDLTSQASGATGYQYKLSEIPESVLPAASPKRAILFGEKMAIRFEGAKPGAQYRVQAVFLSDSDARVEKIEIGAETVEAALALPRHAELRKSWDVPVSAVAQSNLTVTISKVAGPNAVVSAIEILSTDSTPLKAPVSIAERVREVRVPVTRLSAWPNKVDGLSQCQISLNGSWKFSPKLPENAGQLGAEAVNSWKAIAVPGEWAMQGFNVAKDEYACYWREFEIPANWIEHQVKLRFDTVHSDCKVWVNAHLAGAHEGCFIPFELDVTQFAKAGKNRLVVAVKNESLADTLASATAYAGHPLGGITRKVVAFAVPKVSLAAQALTTRFDENFKNATLNIRLEIANDSGSDAKGEAVFELTDPQGKPVPLQTQSAAFEASPAGVAVKEVAITVSSPAQWDTEHPNLYTLRTKIRSGGTSEVVTQRFGFRQIEVRGNGVFVNNHPIKLHGVCRHESHPLLGRSLNAELWRKDAEMFRAANVNYIRTSHYPPPEEFLDCCDELGLFVECEAPLCWVNHSANPVWNEWNYLDTKYFPVLARANLVNVTYNRNHPSIIIWSLANESAWSPLFAEVLRRVKTLDPSRPTSFHDQSWGNIAAGGSTADIANFHYPDTKGPEACDGGARPVLFGEYCHLQTYNHNEGFTDPGVRDQWGPRLGDMFDSMYRHDGNLGGALWSGIDDAFDLPDGQLEGYGFWGVIDAWRRAKPETFHVKKVYSPVRVTTKEFPPGTGPLIVALENRYNFANLSELKIEWRMGNKHGLVRANVPPRSSGEIKIEAAAKAGEVLRLAFTDPRGFVCEEVELPCGKPEAAVVRGLKASPLTLKTNDGAYVISGAQFSCEINSQSGLIERADVGGRPILKGGPVLMALPIEDGPCKPQDLTQFGVSNATCSNWVARAVTACIEADGCALVKCQGSYANFDGGWTLRISSNGTLKIDYDFVTKKDLNPRQAGVVFYADQECDTLNWRRNAPWSCYPADHIGRAVGTAKANPNSATHNVHVDRQPNHAWSLDTTALGTADFRSTKPNVTFAELAGKGRGIALEGPGSQSVRAFVDGARIGWLIAPINTGGGEPFFRPHTAIDRQPLKAGDHVKDSVHLQLTIE